MSRELKAQISESCWRALQAEVERTNTSLKHVVNHALASFLRVDHHTLFQISTIGALVKGVFDGAVRVSDLKLHGDFGLGTFPGLNGEMIMLDGHCYQAVADGKVVEADDDWLLPFAVSTRFGADKTQMLERVSCIDDLKRAVDALRTSDNIFVGLRVSGRFDVLKMRSACKAEAGEDLAAATQHQSEFDASDVEGTLVGFWTPEYAAAINVPGFHVHFISADRSLGGHVLDLQGKHLELCLHLETEFHLVIPETEEFLKADLKGDPTAVLKQVE